MGLLDGWTQGEHTADGRTYPTYRKGSGPGVVVVHEVPGITPSVTAFAEEVVAAGFTVVMPHLFGTPGQGSTAPAIARSIGQVCISREFTKLATGVTTPVAGWLRSLARSLHEELDGPGVGALGMCFTGGFALGMTVDETVLAPVLSQPSLPFPVGRARRAATGVSRTDLDAVKRRAEQGVCVLGLRFTGDVAVPAARFETLRRELGDAFIGVEIDSSRGNPHGIKARAHSVLTLDLVDDAGHPTRDALDQVLDFLRTRLTPERESS